MKILSPPGLHYPITVGDFAKQTHDEVQRSEPLFTYFYETTVEEGNKWGEVNEVKKKFPVKFEASVDGTIESWSISRGTVIARSGVELLEIKEPCTHETQFAGLCVDCGKDMNEVDYLTREANSERAKINMTHDNVALLVSQKEAMAAEEDSKQRLLKAKKLSLIVDLDQTVIHTTCERTIAEWQADPDNPNYDAVKDVRGFQLADDNVANVAANWYYVKMRPGLQNFFDSMSKLYEMHIYTMATRAYAQAVARIIDPERKYFGDRILSRDENYTDKLKSLHRLFPNNTDMVVIIDDRADIWGYSDNLVRVPVFNFFPGAGDINASFLPKQQELVTTASKGKIPDPITKEKSPAENEAASAFSVAANPTEAVLAESTNGVSNELEKQLISMGAGESAEVLEQQVKEQEKVIISQQTERPLLQQQLVLDKEDEEAEESENTETQENGDTQPTEQPRHRAVLHDDDRGLDVIEVNLRRVHKAFYDEHQRSIIMPRGGRVAELKGEKSPKKRPSDGAVPNIAELMPQIKNEVLFGAVVVFSGIIPLGMDVEHSDVAMWVKSFGAEVSLNVNKSTTHVIANPERKTTKVKRAARYPHIKIVTPEWMVQCCTQWGHVDETPYLIELDAADRGGSPSQELEDDSFNVTGDEDGEDTPESPVQLDMSDDNWKSMADELDEFMNESDDTEDASASDSESARSTASTQSDTKVKRKRKRGTESNDDGEESDASVNNKSSGLPSPETTGPEEEQGDEDGKVFDPQGQGADLESDNDDGLAAEMMAELGKSEDEE